MALQSYRVKHGSLVLDGVAHNIGDVVELTEAEVRRMDPSGEVFELVTPPPQEPTP